MSSIKANLSILVHCLWGTIAIMASVAIIAGPVNANEFVTPQSLTEILNSRNIDSISKTMNDIKRQRHKGEILPFIKGLWKLDRSKYPDLPWEVIEMPPVRLEVAHVLVQAVWNGEIDIDIAPMHAFARSQLQDGTPENIVTAMFTLATINDPADISILKEVAKEENRTTFRMSVITISEMCAEGPREAALDEISESLSNKQFRQFTEDYRRKASRFRQSRCDH